jgi:hypothetical protein
VSGAGPGALADLPWMPLYVLVCWLFHPLIGIAAIIGSIILICLTVAAEYTTSAPSKTAISLATRREGLLEASRRNAEVLQAMGMAPHMSARFAKVNESYPRNHAQASDRAGMLSASSKVVRYMLQSFVLGLGAYLVIIQEASAGVIIASAILVSRALAPVELGIANWKGFVAARQARKRLNRLLAFLPERQQTMQLPKPSNAFAVENVAAAPPGTNRAVVHNVGFSRKRRRARHYRTERIRQVVTGTVDGGRLAARQGQGHDRWGRARLMGARSTWPAHRLSAPDRRAVRWNRRREYQQVRAERRFQCHHRRGESCRRARTRRVLARGLRDAHRRERRQSVGRSTPACGAREGALS